MTLPDTTEVSLAARAHESQVPSSYAEKAMASLMQLHSELMEEKERRVDLYRRLMEKEQSLAELKMYVRLLEERVAAHAEAERARKGAESERAADGATRPSAQSSTATVSASSGVRPGFTGNGTQSARSAPSVVSNDAARVSGSMARNDAARVSASMTPNDAARGSASMTPNDASRGSATMAPNDAARVNASMAPNDAAPVSASMAPDPASRISSSTASNGAPRINASTAATAARNAPRVEPVPVNVARPVAETSLPRVQSAPVPGPSFPKTQARAQLDGWKSW